MPFHRAETALAAALLRLSTTPADRMPAFGTVDWGKALAWLRARTGAELAAEQEQAVRLALTQRVAVLTGGPGCGKSFTVKSVITLAAAKRAKIVLAAPTGRAAKRLTELSGHPATTVHRLLQLRPGGDPSFDRDHPLDADLIVVDEASMLDLILANKLIKAVPPGAHLLLVGDVDQLPSVGAGEVLRDVLAADTIPRVRLTQIFRQAQQSGVVVNAHRINAGQPPVFGEHPDFFLFPADEPEATAERVVDLVARRIPRKFGIPPRDIQVLTPMHRGPAGAGTLNTLLQQALAPGREGTSRSGGTGRGCSGPGTRSSRSATTTTRAPPGCSTAPSAPSPPCRSPSSSSRCAPTRTRTSSTTSTSSTNSSTPTPSPCTAPRAANTRPWSCR